MAKALKCDFVVASINYLGHIVFVAGIIVDPLKISVIMEWCRPTSVQQLFGFLSLVGYYHYFVKKYAHITSPLTNLLQVVTKGQRVLQQIEDKVESDASGHAMGVVLTQLDILLAYFSKVFPPSL